MRSVIGLEVDTVVNSNCTVLTFEATAWREPSAPTIEPLFRGRFAALTGPALYLLELILYRASKLRTACVQLAYHLPCFPPPTPSTPHGASSFPQPQGKSRLRRFKRGGGRKEEEGRAEQGSGVGGGPGGKGGG